MEGFAQTAMRGNSEVHRWINYKTLVNIRKPGTGAGIHWEAEHDPGPDSQVRMAKELAFVYIGHSDVKSYKRVPLSE